GLSVHGGDGAADLVAGALALFLARAGFVSARHRPAISLSLLEVRRRAGPGGGPGESWARLLGPGATGSESPRAPSTTEWRQQRHLPKRNDASPTRPRYRVSRPGTPAGAPRTPATACGCATAPCGRRPASCAPTGRSAPTSKTSHTAAPGAGATCPATAPD